MIWKVFRIEAYRVSGTWEKDGGGIDYDYWAFTDTTRMIVGEAFSPGICRMIDQLAGPDAERVKIDFSRAKFEGVQVVLHRYLKVGSGAWYLAFQINQFGVMLPPSLDEGYLCPVLKRYFYNRPQHIYARITRQEETRT